MCGMWICMCVCMFSAWIILLQIFSNLVNLGMCISLCFGRPNITSSTGVNIEDDMQHHCYEEGLSAVVIWKEHLNLSINLQEQASSVHCPWLVCMWLDSQAYQVLTKQLAHCHLPCFHQCLDVCVCLMFSQK